eukprot:m.80588 g.80588  ORF g.80588 m.80588 type:complete len:284 (-) comp14667_c0_seq6:334-1185(-)
MTLAEKTQQKAAYCLGVGALMLATAGLSAAPHRFHFIYAIIITPLLFLRFHQYLSTKREYYLYDLCYGVNGLAVLAMAWPTRNVWMYQTVFVLGNGPMCAAIIIWHNMIVFHSADRLGSFSLHFLVTLLAFTWRWYPAEGQRSVLCSDDTCSLSLWNWLCAPVLFYLAWTSMYLMKTEVLDKQRLAADPELHTRCEDVWLLRFGVLAQAQYTAHDGGRHGYPSLAALQAARNSINQVLGVINGLFSCACMQPAVVGFPPDQRQRACTTHVSLARHHEKGRRVS